VGSDLLVVRVRNNTIFYLGSPNVYLPKAKFCSHLASRLFTSRTLVLLAQVHPMAPPSTPSADSAGTGISEPRYRDDDDEDIPSFSSSNTLAGVEADGGDADALSFLQVEGEVYDDDDEEAGGIAWRMPKSRLVSFLRPSPRLRRAWAATVKWVKGPQPPRPWRIVPAFEQYQALPVRIIDEYFPKRKHKIALLGLFYFLWLLTFSLVLHKSAFAAEVPGYGSPVNIGCLTQFW
jgi:hypothetical protein